MPARRSSFQKPDLKLTNQLSFPIDLDFSGSASYTAVC